MKADIECLDCCVNKVSGLLDQYQADDRVREAVLEKVKEILKQADKDVSAPVLMQQTVDVLEDYFEIDDAYTVPKKNRSGRQSVCPVILSLRDCNML